MRVYPCEATEVRFYLWFGVNIKNMENIKETLPMVRDAPNEEESFEVVKEMNA
jgi:hypothetical protein